MSGSLLAALFLGWQQWGTALHYDSAQSQQRTEFAAFTTAPAPTTTTTTTVPRSTTTTTTTTTAVAAVSITSAPSPSIAPPTTLAPPLDHSPVHGEVVARLEIPTLGLDTMVTVGDTTEDMKGGPIYVPYTPLPGEFGGPSMLIGHRTTYGAPFGDLDKLVPGDRVVVTTVRGRLVYEVTAQRITDPDGADRLAGGDSAADLLLVTCHPKHSTRQRLVIEADIVVNESTAPLAERTPLAAEWIPTTSPADQTDGTSSVPAAQPTTVAVSFGTGWFTDSDAWTPFALLGLTLCAIALGASAISKRSGRNALGAAIGILPFMIALWFWFEALSRLLPQGI